MAELTWSSPPPARGCCGPETRGTCCEPSEKVACCGADHVAGSCGCPAGRASAPAEPVVRSALGSDADAICGIDDEEVADRDANGRLPAA